MHQDDYARVLHNLGLHVQYFPEIQAWCWRTSETLWTGALQTEADALQAMLAYLIEHSHLWLQHVQIDAEVEDQAAVTKLRQQLQQFDQPDSNATKNESEKIDGAD